MKYFIYAFVVLWIAMILSLGYLVITAPEGKCLKSHVRPAYSYYMVKPPMWVTIPAERVCDQHEEIAR